VVSAAIWARTRRPSLCHNHQFNWRFDSKKFNKRTVLSTSRGRHGRHFRKREDDEREADEIDQIHDNGAAGVDVDEDYNIVRRRSESFDLITLPDVALVIER
jgi:hypothetical protein